MPLSPVEEDGLLGQLLVELHYADAPAIAEALTEQARREAGGRTIRLGDLLVERGVLSSDQLAQALEARAALPDARPAAAGPDTARTLRLAASGAPVAPPIRDGAPLTVAGEASAGGASPPAEDPSSATMVRAPRDGSGAAAGPPSHSTVVLPPAGPAGAPGRDGSHPTLVRPAGDALPARSGDTTRPTLVLPVPSTPPAPPPGPRPEMLHTPAAAGTPFGRYRLMNTLGTGGMGTVWKAWDTELRRVVALKQIKHEETTGEEALTRFLREARLAAKLRHPGIIGVHDVGVVDGRHYITMDFVEGPTFAAWLEETRDGKRAGARRGMQRLRHEIGLLADVAGAVAYAHREGVVHRDLKPGNILLDKDERPYVMDFGLAKEFAAEAPAPQHPPASTQMTMSGQSLGTPAYMSPEQASGDSLRIGPRSDVWALGIILFEILTGVLPFEGKTAWEIMSATVKEDPPRPQRKNRHVPDELEAVCLKAIEKDPERRYDSASDFADELRRWLRGEPVLAKKPSLVYYGWRWLTRRKAMVIPAAVGAVLIAAALGWVWHERAIGHERAQGMLEESSTLVRKLEASILKSSPKPLEPEVKELLAKLPLAQLNKLIEDDPGFGPAWSWRAKAEELLGDAAAAEADYDQGCARSPEYAVVWFLRASHRLEQELRTRPPARTAPAVLASPLAPAADAPPEAASLRAGWQSDLREMLRAQAGDRSFQDLDRWLGGALAAIGSAGPDGAGRALEVLAHPPAPKAPPAAPPPAGRPLPATSVSQETRRQLELIANTKALRLEGILLHAQQRFEQAVAACSKAVVEWPQDDLAALLRARALEAQAATEQAGGTDPGETLRAAISQYADAIRGDPVSEAGYRGRAFAACRLAEVEAIAGRDAERVRTRIAPDLVLADTLAFLRAAPHRLPPPAWTGRWCTVLARAALAGKCCGGARAAALAAAGKRTPLAAASPVDAATAKAARTRSGACLAAIDRLGLLDRTALARDPDFAPLRDDPRYQALFEPRR